MNWLHIAIIFVIRLQKGFVSSATFDCITGKYLVKLNDLTVNGQQWDINNCKQKCMTTDWCR